MIIFGIIQDQLLYLLHLGATSLFTLFIGFLIAKLLGRTVYCLFLYSKLDTLAKSFPVKFSPTQFFSQFVTYLFDVIAIILALHVLNLAFTIIFFIIGILILASILGCLFWLKDTVINIIARICLVLRMIHLRSGQVFSLYAHSLNGTIQTTSATAIILKSGKDLYEIPYVVIKP
ncbi:MAG: hypothetical protein Q7K43_04995 [Candidatus Woesearchaeota archaeon]|nr:hypothetical protein [Candidatus Woesearchaeota archaeon]